MSGRTFYSLAALSLVADLLLLTYLDNGRERRPGYIFLALGMMSLVYLKNRYTARRYLARGGQYVDARKDEAKFRKWMRADAAVAVFFIGFGILWVALTL